jgi:hypothetical protein
VNEWKVVEDALRPYLRRKFDDEAAARDVFRGLAAAGFVLVELPAPTDLGNYGAVWDAGVRNATLPVPEYGGPIGTVQYRPDTGRIEVRDDYERDYLPQAVWADAAVLLAAFRYAAQHDTT